MKGFKIEEYIPFVKKIASNYTHSGLPFDELLQEGMLGLWEAIHRFDPDKKIKLTSFAKYWIKKRIIDAINIEKNTHLNVPACNENISVDTENNTNHANEKKLDLPDNTPDLEKKVLLLYFENQLTLNEIAKKLNITREKSRQLKEKGLRRLKLNSI